MQRYLFVGDLHGDLERAERAITYAATSGANILQVGDWGFLWPGSDGIDELVKLLDSHQVTMRYCDGNHDDHHRLRRNEGSIAPNLIYQPRSSVYEDADGTRFLFMGGAPSIDRSIRTPGLSWWPEEEIRESEVYAALDVAAPIHVLVTHDAAELPPGVSSNVGDPAFERSANRSTGIIFKLAHKFRPELHVHGHYHQRYTRVLHGTLVEGLASNLQRFDEMCLLWSREP